MFQVSFGISHFSWYYSTFGVHYTLNVEWTPYYIIRIQKGRSAIIYSGGVNSCMIVLSSYDRTRLQKPGPISEAGKLIKISHIPVLVVKK